MSTVSGLTSGTHYTFGVRAINSIGAGSDATSSPVAPTAAHIAPVDIDPPAITGSDTAGRTLTCSHGAWADDPSSFRYQWSRDSEIIHGATRETYKIETADEGHDLSCTVTARDSAGATHSTSSQVAIPLATTADCPTASGTLSGTTLGPVSLGETQEHARAGLPRYDRYSYHTDNFCLANGHGIRVGYGSAKLAATARMQHPVTGQIVVALTANPHYALDGVHPGQSLSTAASRLHLSKPMRSGKNTWYTVRGHASTGVLKVRQRLIEEVGIANRKLIGHHRSEQKLLHSF